MDTVDLTGPEDARQEAPQQEQQGGRAAAAPDGELAREAMREATSSVLLPFQRALVEELLEEDGLCVLSPGLGLHQVVAVLLRLQDARLRQPGQRGCVLVLGAAPWQRDALRRELLRIDPVIRAKAEAVVAGGGGGARARDAGEHPAHMPLVSVWLLPQSAMVSCSRALGCFRCAARLCVSNVVAPPCSRV
jgi:hypothetical protein